MVSNQFSKHINSRKVVYLKMKDMHFKNALYLIENAKIFIYVYDKILK